MIKAEVRCAEELVMTRFYDEPALTLEGALARVQSYIIEERLNENGECVVRLVFGHFARRRLAASTLARP